MSCAIVTKILFRFWMRRFISARILGCVASTAFVPFSAEVQDLARSLWLHNALAKASETRQTPLTVSLAPGLKSVIGIAAVAGRGLSVVGALALYYEHSRHSDRAATECDFGMSALRVDSWMMRVET